MKRREFLASLTAVTVASTVAVKGFPNINTGLAVPFTLPPLPYAENALSPVISSNTVGFHYGKHHKGYVDNLNNISKGTKYENMTLESVVRQSAKSKTDTAIFNNAAQIWNHNFYWNSLKPN